MQTIEKIVKRIRFHTHRENYNKLISNFNDKRFEEIVKKFEFSDPAPGYSKYLEAPQYIKKYFNIFLDLELQKLPSQNILDIGTGAGYFPFICNHHGHLVKTIDLDTVEMYNEMIEFLNISRKVWEVKSFENLPDFEMKFDLVTAFMICFNNHKTDNVWDVKEWEFFLQDLAKNHISNSGKIFLVLNAENDGSYYSNELKKFFLGTGAEVDENKIFYPSVTKLRD